LTSATIHPLARLPPTPFRAQKIKRKSYPR